MNKFTLNRPYRLGISAGLVWLLLASVPLFAEAPPVAVDVTVGVGAWIRSSHNTLAASHGE
ncbi:MAG: hypothetical protein M3H12_19790 [Chromatiales bacterium]|nr:hypothetical protein [Gammaproteobacteria bacterium]